MVLHKTEIRIKVKKAFILIFFLQNPTKCNKIKKQNSENRREIQLFPTKKAIDLSKPIIEHSTQHNNNMLDTFSTSEKEQLFNLLNKVYNNLNKKD